MTTVVLERLQTPVPKVKTWGGKFDNTNCVITYDMIHNLWQGSFKRKGEPIEYMANRPFDTIEELLLAFSRKFRREFQIK